MVVGLFGTAAYAAPVSPYKDGVYTGAATAKPDEDADFDAYGIKVDVTYYVKGDNGYAIYQYPVSVDVKENPGVMTAAFADETKVTVASLPADIKNPVATISSRVGRGETPVVIADAVPVVDGAILLAEAPVDGTSYTVNVVSDNYGDASATITYEAPKPQNPLADWAKTAKETGADAADVISAIVTGEAYSAEAMTDEEFITALYQNLFGREPDQGGLKAWVKVLLDGEATGYTLAKGFFHSQEFVGKNLPDEDFLRIAYRAVLGREAEDVVKQLLGRADITGQESIDAVSGATCSSISIAQACARALEKAKR